MAERLLLIEDDLEAARRIDRALGDAEFAVHRVPTGGEGLAFLTANSVAAIVLGEGRAVADALHTVRQIREHRVASPILVLSGTDSIERAVQAIKAGAYDFVAKRDDYLPTLVGKVREAVAELRARMPSLRVVRPVFVGRETELRLFDEEYARAIAGEGRAVLVVGDEGIGKTSLALEMTRRVRRRGALVLWGRSHETGGAPAYWPWVQILRRYVDTADPETLCADLGESAAAVGRIAPSVRERCPDLPAADAGELTRFHLVDGVTQFLKRLAVRRPLVLVLDDLHRADGDSLHLLRFFASESADAPVLLLGTYRDGGVEAPLRAELARVAGQPLTTVLRLAGLDVAEVRRYVEEATAVRPSLALAEAIHAKTEGHPLFVAEVTRLLATDGRLADDGAAGDLRLAIPATRRQAIADRLARLSGRCRRLLKIAAVVGYDFTSALVAAVAGEEPHAVREILDEAIDVQLVAASEDDPGACRFAHVLVRDVLYDGIAPEERRGLHAHAAAVLAGEAPEHAAGPGADAPLAAIAHHALEAATGADDFERAFTWITAAGDRAAAVMAYEEAARHYALALGVGERAGLATPARMSGLLVKLAEAHWHAGDMSGARAAGRRALDLAKAAGEPEVIGRAALTFAGRLPGFGAIVSDAEVVSELEYALAVLPDATAALRAQVMARLAEELAYSPRGGGERSLGQQAIALARAVGDPGVLAAVLRTTQWSVWTADAVERRRQLAAEIVALAERTGDRVLALDGQLLRLWSALEHGETDAAWRQLDLCTRLAAALRLPHYAWVTAAARACLHIATGRLDDAERLAEQAAGAGERAGNPTVTLFVGAQRMHVKSLRGQVDEVGDWVRDVLSSFPLLAATMECSLILTYARAGQRERARAELAGLVADEFARVPWTPAWLMNMAFLANACAAIGDEASAGSLYGRMAPFASYNIVVPPALVLAPVAHYVGGLAALIGDEPVARRHYEDALALEARTGSRQYLALTQIAYGRLLGRSACAADRERAAGLTASGRTIAAELRLDPVVCELDAAAAAAPRLASARAVFRKHGDRWEIEFHGRPATVPDRVGMSYLRCLLERPGVPVSALELAGLGCDAMLVEHDGGPAIDRRAMAEVQRRIAEIDGDVAACARRNAVVSADLLRERAECVAYVTRRGTGLVSAADRARSGVTKAIGRAIQAITRVDEGLGHHLERHVETGRLCVYVPDPGAPLAIEP